MIDNSKFIITNQIQTDKYAVSIVTDVSGIPSVLTIYQNGNLKFFSDYKKLSISEDVTNNLVNITSDGFVGQFSVNNTDSWVSTNGFITDLLTDITG